MRHEDGSGECGRRVASTAYVRIGGEGVNVRLNRATLRADEVLRSRYGFTEQRRTNVWRRWRARTRQLDGGSADVGGDKLQRGWCKWSVGGRR